MKIIECKKIDVENYDNIIFIRIEPEDLSITIREIINSLSDMSWISQFDQQYVRLSFEDRAKNTAKYLANKINSDDENQLTKDTGEYVVSELARQAIVSELKYMDIPLAELFKEQVSGNPGFDFYSANLDKVIIFGEAKYKSNENAYGRAMKQVDNFINNRQDISDLIDIRAFFEEESLNKVASGEKGYAVAFAAKSITSDSLIKNIIRNKYYKNLALHKEVIYLAVNV